MQIGFIDDKELEELQQRLWLPEPRVTAPELINRSQMPKSLEEIGKELGVSRERARQIEIAALQKCKAWCARQGYRLEDLLTQ